MELAALFSGGKDSHYSTYLASKMGHHISVLITALAPEASYMYHVPAVSVSHLAAQTMGIPQRDFQVTLEDEIGPLREVLLTLDVDGVCAGAIASEYQRSRVAKVCQELGLELITPLWHRDPVLMLLEMMNLGFEIMIVAVAAMGLDAQWLGQTLRPGNIDRFLETCHKNRIHPGGEGGEYESLVLAAPHMKGRICLKYDIHWTGMRGELMVKEAWLEETPSSGWYH